MKIPLIDANVGFCWVKDQLFVLQQSPIVVAPVEDAPAVGWVKTATFEAAKHTPNACDWEHCSIFLCADVLWEVEIVYAHKSGWCIVLCNSVKEGVH